MNYQELTAAPLPCLAWRTLNESLPIDARLSAWEMLNARLEDVEKAWNGYGQTGRAQILAALALDLSADGFAPATV